MSDDLNMTCHFCGLSKSLNDANGFSSCISSPNWEHVYDDVAQAAEESNHFRQPGKDEYGNRVPQDSDFRKQLPVFDGLLDYFPDALAYVSLVSLEGAEKHCNGRLGWNRDVSTDHLNCVARHLLDIRGRDPHSPRKLRHAGMAIWRLLAYLQTELEKSKANGESWV